ncbi:MAG: hypothetical protein ACLU4N_13225 [Butyricimonas faecihominis]
MNRIIILLGFIAFHVTSFAQQKGKLRIGGTYAGITQAPISKNTLLIRPTFIKGVIVFTTLFKQEKEEILLGGSETEREEVVVR